MQNRINTDVIFAGDAQITYQEMITVWDQLKQGGVRNVNMQTQPPTGRRLP
jgi:biopolymer transport protein ExbD